jgi:hypothetical protein
MVSVSAKKIFKKISCLCTFHPANWRKDIMTWTEKKNEKEEERIKKKYSIMERKQSKRKRKGKEEKKMEWALIIERKQWKKKER